MKGCIFIFTYGGHFVWRPSCTSHFGGFQHGSFTSLSCYKVIFIYIILVVTTFCNYLWIDTFLQVFSTHYNCQKHFWHCGLSRLLLFYQEDCHPNNKLQVARSQGRPWVIQGPQILVSRPTCA